MFAIYLENCEIVDAIFVKRNQLTHFKSNKKESNKLSKQATK